MGWQAPDGKKRTKKRPAFATEKASASPARGQKPSAKRGASPLQRYLTAERQKSGYRTETPSYNVGRTRRRA